MIKNNFAVSKKFIIIGFSAIFVAAIMVALFFSWKRGRGRLISENGNIRVYDIPLKNHPLCGKVMILRGSGWIGRGEVVSELEMCEENVLRVFYKGDIITLETDGGMAEVHDYIKINAFTGKRLE